MKKRISIILTILMLATAVLSSSLVSYAQNNPNRIVDELGLLTTTEEASLEEELKTWCDANEFDAVVVITDEGNSNDDNSLEEYADDFFDYGYYGYGDTYDGCILVIDMESRDFHISTCGTGINILTDARIGYLVDHITPYLKDGDYYNAISDGFIGNLKKIYAAPLDDPSFDKGKEPLGVMDIARILGVSIVFAFVIAFILAQTKKAKLKSLRLAREANNYVVRGSAKLTRRDDRFLYSTVVATPKPKEESSGSSIHTSSSGRSHGGGGGSF